MYGSLSTLILVMVWLYFCMNLLLYGAEINAYFESQFRRGNASVTYRKKTQGMEAGAEKRNRQELKK